MTATQPTLDAARLRVHYAEEQGLGRRLAGKKAAEVVASTGWLRSVGGCNPYLALRNRAGLGRDAVDGAVAAGELQELPAVRGCTYVVSEGDFALALLAAQLGGDAEMAMATKHLGVTEKEVDALAQEVLDAVAREPLEPSAIRDAVGSAARSLGEAGKKRGMANTLPLALGRLQVAGEIRRVSSDGRLDQQRYRYARWRPSPLAKAKLDKPQVARELARRFFRWAGPATVAQLAWWSGLGVTASRAAAAEVGVVPVLDGDLRLLFPEDKHRVLSRPAPKDPDVSFASSIDNLLHLRRDLTPHLADGDAARARLGDEKGRAGGTLLELDYHPIVDRGRVVGLWDWDGVEGELVWRTFGPAPKGVKEAAKELAAYVTADLGDVRTMSLDSPARRSPRLEALRNAKL